MKSNLMAIFFVRLSYMVTSLRKSIVLSTIIEIKFNFNCTSCYAIKIHMILLH